MVRKMLQDMPEYIILGQATFQGIRQSKCQNAFGYMSEHMIKPYVRQYVRQYNRTIRRTTCHAIYQTMCQNGYQ